MERGAGHTSGRWLEKNISRPRLVMSSSGEYKYVLGTRYMHNENGVLVRESEEGVENKNRAKYDTTQIVFEASQGQEPLPTSSKSERYT